MISLPFVAHLLSNASTQACGVILGVALSISSLPDPPIASFQWATTTTTITVSASNEWQFDSGQVRLDDPFWLDGRKYIRPSLLGIGGGGAVFSYDGANGEPEIALKVSWLRSAASVSNECDVLRAAQERSKDGLKSVVMCLKQEPYPGDSRRVQIVLSPVAADDSVSSVLDLAPDIQRTAVKQIVKTLLSLLSARIVTSDVQPLISITTGEVLFIDFTEAKVLPLSGDLSPIDLALVASFCNEVFVSIPEPLLSLASEVILDELKSGAIEISADVREILAGQPWLPQSVVELLEN